ncbi:MAG: YhfC family intramembrane metalloprotease [Ruminococcaceae bacterium]|nr:YhfC family intramembrane metalloprotease [Oscillospiraceae bacterium]
MMIKTGTVVSAPLFVSFLFAAAAEIVLPIVLLIVLCWKKKINKKPMFLGFASFFVSQILLRLQILNVLKTQDWFKAFAANAIPYLMMLAFTAGLFEESARYLFAGFLQKKDWLFRDAIAFGLGHGFCEVILLTGMTQINNITYSIMINNGTLQKTLATYPDMANQILAAMAAATPQLVFLGVLERVFAVAFHLFATVLVFKALNERRPVFYLLALLAHFVLDFAAATLSTYTNPVLTEGVVFALSVVWVFLIFKLRPSFPKAETESE